MQKQKMLYKDGTEVKVEDLCMLPTGKVGTIAEINSEMFQVNPRELTKITNRTAIKLN